MFTTTGILLDIFIDVNTTYKFQLILAKECYHCKNPNHIVYNCLVRLDIQQLTTKQREKLIENLNILKNIEITQ